MSVLARKRNSLLMLLPILKVRIFHYIYPYLLTIFDTALLKYDWLEIFKNAYFQFAYITMRVSGNPYLLFWFPPSSLKNSSQHTGSPNTKCIISGSNYWEQLCHYIHSLQVSLCSKIGPLIIYQNISQEISFKKV